MTNYFPSYALLVVSLNKGITQITKEHMMICRNLHVPIIVVLSKIDLAPEEKAKETLNDIKALCKKCQIKFIYEIEENSNLEQISEVFQKEPNIVCPIIKISNKTGYNINLLKTFLFTLNRTSSIGDLHNNDITHLFIIYRPYNLDGIGWVLHGKCMLNEIKKNDKLYLGPLNKEYIEIRIRSIHSELRQEIPKLTKGESGCIAIKILNSIYDVNYHRLSNCRVCINKPITVNKVRADILVTSARVTINKGYAPYFHYSHGSGLGYIIEGDAFPLRYGDRASVVIEFKTPQFVYPNLRLIIRDGNVRAIGIIKEIC